MGGGKIWIHLVPPWGYVPLSRPLSLCVREFFFFWPENSDTGRVSSKDWEATFLEISEVAYGKEGNIPL